MNAIVFCDGQGSKLEGGGCGGPICLTNLAGRAVLDYILSGLARLGLTRIIFCTGPGASGIRKHVRTRLPGPLARFASCPTPGGAASLAALTQSLTMVEPTGLLFINGDCIFEPGLVDMVVAPGSAVIPYVAGIRSGSREPLLALAKERVLRVGRGVADAAGTALGIRYVPRTYLPALRGAVVELLAAGAESAPYDEVFGVLIEHGFPFIGVEVGMALYAEIPGPGYTAAAINTALELQRRGGSFRWRRSPAEEHNPALAAPLRA